MSHLTLSPNGEWVAGRLSAEGHEVIAVSPTARYQVHPLMRLDHRGTYLRRLGWSDDDRIVGSAGMLLIGAAGVRAQSGRLFSVSRDGEFRRILGRDWVWRGARQFEDLVLDWAWSEAKANARD